jgi:hypothetical protein
LLFDSSTLDLEERIPVKLSLGIEMRMAVVRHDISHSESRGALKSVSP